MLGICFLEEIFLFDRGGKITQSYWTHHTSDRHAQKTIISMDTTIKREAVSKIVNFDLHGLKFGKKIDCHCAFDRHVSKRSHLSIRS